MIVSLESKTIWWAVLALVALWQGCSPVGAVLLAPGQKAVMLAINDEWPFLQWHSSNLDGDCSELYGVWGCNSTGWVTWVVLSDSTSVPIPEAFCGMAAMYSFASYGAGGDFPACFATMPSLRTLSLSGGITGSLPSDWSAATSLTTIRIEGQAISGPLPTILPPSLSTFSIKDNTGILSGSIPQAYLDHPTLAVLALPQNGLSGAIPFPSIITNSVLNTYTIDKRLDSAPADFLYGELPSNLFQWSYLVTLSLVDVAINGSFPSDEIPVGCSIQKFIVSDWGISSDADVQMTGSIPPEIGRCTSLVEFNVWNARMSGFIPVELLNISTIRTLHLATNQFEGTLPTNWPHTSPLTYINLARNNLHGPVPATISDRIRDGPLTNLYLDYNDLELCGDPEFNLPTGKFFNCNARFNRDSQISCECRSRWTSRCVDSYCPEPGSNEEPSAAPHDSTTPGTGPFSTPPSTGIPTAQSPVSSSSITQGSFSLLFLLLICYLAF